MENFTRRWKWSISIAIMGFLTLYSCTDVEMREELKESGVSLNRNAPVNISGQIIDPLTCLPVANATITTGTTTIITDSEGNFDQSVETANLGSVFTVEKEGHVTYNFTVDFDEYNGNIRIDLPTRQNCIWAGPGEGAWYKVNTNNNCVTYVVDILSTVFDEWTEVCVGPGGNAYGAGIDEFFAQPSISVETPDNPDVEYIYGVDVRVDPASLLAAGRKSECLAEGSSIAAAIASGLTNTDDILSVLFGNDNNTQLVNGQVVILAPIQGTIIPGVGIISVDPDTGNVLIFPYTLGGTLGSPILITPGTNFPGEPHQSVPDGDG